MKIKKNHTEFFLWKERLKQFPLFFLDNKVEKVFYDKPDGNIVNVLIKPSKFENGKNYIMHPIKTEGIWMKVKL